MHLTLNKWLFHLNGFSRTSLSATVTRVSNFDEENVFLSLHGQGSQSRCIQCAQHVKYFNRSVLSMFIALNKCLKYICQVRIQRGGQGVRTPPPPGNSQVIWVSIGNKQLDPPPPEKLDPPPPGKCWTPSGTLKNDRLVDFFELTI